MSNPQTENGYIKISTELFEEFCKIRINGEARQILDFIIRKTYGWNKKEDHISFTQFEKGTGINRRNTIRAIKKLKEMNMISVETDTTKGNIYRINKKYNTWLPSVRNDTVVSKRVKGSVKTCKKVVSETTHTIDTIQKTNTIDTYERFKSVWNENISDPKVIKLSQSRIIKIKSRLKNNVNFLDDFKNCLLKTKESDFLSGKVSDWRVTFDWFIKNDDNYVKVLEDTYKTKGGNYGKATNRTQQSIDAGKAYIAKLERQESDSDTSGEIISITEFGT